MRKLFSIVSLVCLMLAGGLAVLWGRSYRGIAAAEADQVGWTVGGVRHTLRSEPGVIVLRRPPRVDLPPGAVVWLEWFSSDDMEWRVDAWWRSVDQLQVGAPGPTYLQGPSGEAFKKLQHRPQVWREPMLRALEDPRKFAAAHVELVRLKQLIGIGPIYGRTGGDPLVSRLHGLRVEVRRPTFPERSVLDAPSSRPMPKMYEQIRLRWGA